MYTYKHDNKVDIKGFVTCFYVLNTWCIVCMSFLLIVVPELLHILSYIASWLYFYSSIVSQKVMMEFKITAMPFATTSEPENWNLGFRQDISFSVFFWCLGVSSSGLNLKSFRIISLLLFEAKSRIWTISLPCKTCYCTIESTLIDFEP